MREILFRGKIIGTEIWEYGGFTAGLSGYFIISAFEYNRPEFSEYVSVAPETVGQFTGMLDKNGNRIFDGDVIGWEQKFNGVTEIDNEFIVVKWIINGFRFVDKYDQIVDYDVAPSEWIIIGNIHDNPELLKESDRDGR